MKILMLCDALGIGGAETHILTLIDGLINNQNSVTLITSGGIYEEKAQRSGAKIIHAPLNKRDIFSLIKSFRIIKKSIPHYDIIHAHTRLSSYLAVRARGRYSLPKIVVSAHLNFQKNGVGRLTKWGDVTLAVSEDIKEHLIKVYGVKEEKILLTKNGIDLREYNGKLCDKKRIVHISRIDKDRCAVALLLCKIAPELLSKFKDYCIDIYGDGSEMEELKAAAKSANEALGKVGVVLHGATDDAAKELLYGGIFVGVSRAALEAMAMRLPVIIAGNEGYGSMLCKENFTILKKSNLCARGLGKPTARLLFNDICALIENSRLYSECANFCYETAVLYYSKESMVADAKSAYLLAKSRINLSVLGYFGFGNLGDEQTLSVLLGALRSKNAKITGIISNTADAKKKTLFSVLRDSDALILGGGNLLQNETSLRSLLYYTAIIFLASAMKKRVIPIASGIGKINGGLASVITTLAVSRCWKIGARTRLDKRDFMLLGGKEIMLMPDLCFTLDKSIEAQPQKSFLVIFKDGKSIKKETLELILKETDLSPIAVMISHNDESDSVSNICSSLDIKLNFIHTYSELSALISSCAFTITEKLHGAIFSLVNHKRCFINTNSKKSFSLYKEIESRCNSFEIQNPLIPISKIAPKYIKEVGAFHSDFDKLLNSLREDIKSSLDELI